MSFYCNIKEKVARDQKNHVIYKIKCPGCNDCYIGKTERCLTTRITEHGTKETISLNVNCFKTVVCCPVEPP